MAHTLGTSQSSQNLRAWAAYPSRRLPHSPSSVSLLLPQSTSYQSFGYGSRVRSSGTWTTSSGELGLLNNADEVDDREVFIHEYNRLAKKHGVRQLKSDDFDAHQPGNTARYPEKRNWLSRILRSNPGPCPHSSSLSPPPPQLRHKRSVSEFAHIIHCRRDSSRIIEIQDMVRLSGKSMLYLPQEYSPCSLILPTCLRATAQHLAQNVATRGLFRVPGSSKVISALFDYYCFENGNANIASTVRCATLPLHIQYSVHDIASTFKRLLSVIPGGILGSLALLDAFIAIHSQLNGEPEYPRTKQTKVRARLIALAIGTIKSQYRREVICAVFGLLSLIGRTAEVAPREDEDSRPLPTADLMGYNALGIVFGPLLVGDMLDQYTMKVVTPTSGMLLFPLSPPRFRRDRRKSAQIDNKNAGPPTIDKILVANNITEMLIANWRDVVRQMKSLGTHYRKDTSTLDLTSKNEQHQSLQGSNLAVPLKADERKDEGIGVQGGNELGGPEMPTREQRKRRLKVLRRATSQRLMPKMSIATLSPTKEESLGDDETSDRNETQQKRESVIQRLQKAEQNRWFNAAAGANDADIISRGSLEGGSHFSMKPPPTRGNNVHAEAPPSAENTQVYLESVPPRESSKQIVSQDGLSRQISNGSIASPALWAGITSDAGRPRQMSKTRQPPVADINEGGTTSPLMRCTNYASPPTLNSKDMPEGGIRVVQQSPGQALDVEPSQSWPLLDIGDIGAPYASHDQGIQCDMASENKRQLSINVTPERFYAYVDTLPDKDDRFPGDMQDGQSSEKHQTVIHQPRLSRSLEHLRSQNTINIQSPTMSTKSKGLSKRESVKAMAAMFETQTTGHHPQPLTGSPTAATEASSMHLRGQESKSDSGWTHQIFDHLVEPEQNSLGERTLGGQEVELHQVVMRLLDDRHQEASLDSEIDGSTQDVFHRYSPSRFLGKPGSNEANGMTLKAVPSLGTMVPCREQPPIAHHLNLARPLSSTSIMPDSDPGSVVDVISTMKASQPRSATVLYSQIRNLQRQLNAKTEEAAQLRRQVEAQKDSDVGTVSEQLRQAKRDVATWKDRAETAERRVKVFEKFTEKLKAIRDTFAETRGDDENDEAYEHSMETASDNVGAHKAIAALRNVQNRVGEECADRDDDASLVAAKLRMCLHELSATQDGTLESDRVGCTGGDEHVKKDSCNCLATRMRDSSLQIWAAAEELLEMQDEAGAV